MNRNLDVKRGQYLGFGLVLIAFFISMILISINQGSYVLFLLVTARSVAKFLIVRK